MLKRSAKKMKTGFAVLLISNAVLCLSLLAVEEKNGLRSAVFEIQVPKDSLFLVAIDRGEKGNRRFLDMSNPTEAKGVDPVLGQMMREPATVQVSLEYPRKRKNSKTIPMWTVFAGYSYKEQKTLKGGGELKTDWKWEVGYGFEMATKIQRIIYQTDDRIHEDYEINITETPRKMELDEVETGIAGLKFYQIPFAEVDGETRSIAVLVAKDFDEASKALSISDENPKFRWSVDWFQEQPSRK